MDIERQRRRAKEIGASRKGKKPPKSRIITRSSDISIATPAQVARFSSSRTEKNEKKILNLLQNKSLPDNPDKLPDPRELIQRAIAADLDTSVFTQENFDVSKNVIDWCRNPKFLGTKMDLFAKQIQILAHFFSDICFQCSDVDYAYDVPVDASVGETLDRLVLLEHGVCPQCKRNRTEMLHEWQRDSRFASFNSHLEAATLSKIRPVPANEFVGVWGQRSGKSFLVSTFAWTYILHRYLALPSLSKYFDQADNVVFEASFVAPTIKQVKKYLWLPFRHAFYDSPWFRELREYLTVQGKKLGVPLYQSEQTYIQFTSKRIVIQMLAANSSSLRGGTRFFTALDELGWFNSKEGGSSSSGISGVRDGQEVFQSLSNSLRTFRSQADTYRRGRLKDYNSLDGYMFNISSPSSINDPIMTRAAQATTSHRIFYSHFATWEVNPRESEELICEEFAGDPVKLRRDFYAIPPKAMSPFIEDDGQIDQLTYEGSGEDFKLFETTMSTFQDVGGNYLLRPTPSQIKSDPYTPRALSIDNGEVKNSFALSIAKYYPEHQGVLFEEFVEVAPYEGHSVDLAWCYDNFIIPLIKSFNFLYVGFDRWNSAYAIHDLRTTHGVMAERITLRKKDFDDFRNDVYGSKTWFSKSETSIEEVLMTLNLPLRARWPRAHFKAQVVTVEQHGSSIPMKPSHGNDDLFRTGVLNHRLIKANLLEFQKKTKLSHYVPLAGTVGFFSSRSGKKVQNYSGSRARRTNSGGGGGRRPTYGTGGIDGMGSGGGGLSGLG